MLVICCCSNLISLSELKPSGYFSLVFICHQLPQTDLFSGFGLPKSLNPIVSRSISKELNSFLSLNTLQNLQLSLTALCLYYGWLHWKSIPEQVQHLTSLTFLRIDGFGIETSPHWLGNLSCLQTIIIEESEKLERLSNMESFTKLVELYILRYPILKQRRPGWSEIPPRTEIYIDDRRNAIQRQN
ncbi:hypothetical protein LguiB_027021 [Lonicera macranthoides]